MSSAAVVIGTLRVNPSPAERYALPKIANNADPDQLASEEANFS